MNEAEMKAELERLRAENAKLKSKDSAGLSLKVSEKGAVSLHGMGRFPVTLYKEQWLRILPALLRSRRSSAKTTANSRPKSSDVNSSLLSCSPSGTEIWRKRRPGPPAEGAQSDGLRLRLTHKLMRRQIMLFIPW
jgi:hypothetical protein